MLFRLFRPTVQPDPQESVQQEPQAAPAATAPVSAAPEPSADDALLDALKESRQRFKDIVEVSGDFAWETDALGRFVFVSSGGMLGHSPDYLVGKPARHFLSDRGAGRDTPFAAREPARDVDVWLRTAEGRSACLRTSAIPVLDAGGSWEGARGVCRDVTEERREHAAFVALQFREALMARIVRAASSALEPDEMLATALSETRRALSAVHVDLRRPDDDGAFAVIVADSEMPPGDPPVLRTVIARMAESRSMVTAADGEHYYLCAPTVFRGGVNGAILIVRALAHDAWTDDERAFSDELAAQFAIMQAQIDSHRKLEALARKDELTGLLNRRAFIADLQDRLARVGAGGAGGAMFYADFDNFKLVNDVHGHKRGDQALVALADLLTAKTRPGDLVARLGGDEFALWLERTDAGAAEARARDLLDAAQGLRLYSGVPDRPLGISLGIAVAASGTRESFQDLAARADRAMYEVKHEGKAGFALAGPAEPGAGVADRTNAAKGDAPPAQKSA